MMFFSEIYFGVSVFQRDSAESIDGNLCIFFVPGVGKKFSGSGNLFLRKADLKNTEEDPNVNAVEISNCGSRHNTALSRLSVTVHSE